MTPIRRYALVFAAFAAIAIAAPQAATAQVLYNNGTPDGADGFSVSPFATQADIFTLGSNSIAGAFQWYAFADGFTVNPTLTADYHWAIRNDDGGTPGTFVTDGMVTGGVGTLTGFACCSGSGKYAGYFFDQSIAPVSLGAGSYWLTLDGFDDGALGRGYWASGSAGSAQFSVDDGVTWTAYSGTGLAFSILGPESVAVTPEPATLPLLATGLVGIVVAGGRRRKRNG
jgi:PEP-CTERM motif-containing protein